MPRKTKQAVSKAVTWLSEKIVDPNCLSNSFQHYKKFQFQNIVAEVGDYILISNADAAEPDTEDGCDAARIVSLYEDSTNKNDPFRAKVQWYSRPSDLPDWCFNKMEPIDFMEKEVIEDHRPFNTDVSIETFYKKCSITFTFTRDTDQPIKAPFHYICRYRLMSMSKRKVQIEPVTEEERRAMQLLCTPAKSVPSPRQSKTPTSLIKRMSRVSLSEQKNWSISKTEGTKLLLRRAILADKTEKDSPKKTPVRTPKSSISESPRSVKPLNRNNVDELISIELKGESDDELPTLIIRQTVPTTPKRKQSVTNINELTPKKSLTFDEDEKRPFGTRSSRVTDKKDSPKKAFARTPKISVSETPKSVKKLNRNNLDEIISMELQENSDEELPTLIITQHVPTTPKRKQSVTKTNEDTPKKTILFDEDEKNPYATRSGRVTKLPANYIEDEISPVKRTPRRTRKVTESDDDFKPTKSKQPVFDLDEDSPVKRTPRRARKVTESDDDFKPAPKTPKTPRTSRTPRTPAQTPKRAVSRKIISQLTPTLHTRAHSVVNIDEFMRENKSLPGRESQMDEILSFVRTKLLDSTSGCMYISGVPGTGKTATVCSALKILKDEVDLPDFQLVEVNGMRIAEPRQAYVQIYKQLTGKTVVWEQACSLLEKRFTNPGPRRSPTVLLVDELDALCTRRQDVLYSIMEWAAHGTALLTVLAVANTMDLPERALAARVASRLGLTRLTFPPYSHTQLQTIVATRLAGANVTPDAVQLIARKVAAVSGDARRALALCTRALELAGPGGAGLGEVQRALGDAGSGVSVAAIRHCSSAERLMLRAVAAEVERTGSDETTLSRALSTASAIVALDGRPYRAAAHVRAPTPSQAQAICARLAALRLLLLEPKPSEPRLLLNVSVDDVHYATRQITV